MSPRARKIRRVLNPPIIKGFKPYGNEIGTDHSGGHIALQLEEYEALRLCDYEMYTHHEAAVIMGVSRPTLTRIYASVRQKIARAFAEGLSISIEGGKVYFDSDWYECHHCKSTFNNPNMEEKIAHCPLCGSEQVSEYEMELPGIYPPAGRQGDRICICTSCGYEMEHNHRKPCHAVQCPKCRARMQRKENNSE